MRSRFKILVISACLLLGSYRVFCSPRPTDGRDMGLTIIGTIVQQNKESVALIKEAKTGSVKAIKVGFTVLSEYKVVDITLKYIVVSKGPQQILVYQDKFANEFAGSRNESSQSTNAVAVSTQENFSEDGFERKSGNVSMTASYRNKLVNQDLAKILMQATAEPYSKDGQIIGFILSQIDAGSIYDKTGFRDGDIVTVINGHKLNNLAGAVVLLRSLKNEDKVDVELIRGGQNVSYKIEVH